MTKLASWHLKLHSYYSWAYLEKSFSSDECDAIVEYCDKLPLEKALLGEGNEDSLTRSNLVGWVDEQDDFCVWLYERLTSCVTRINDEFWNFNLDYIQPLQYTKYRSVGDHYNSHIDMGKGPHYRKLSFSLQLTDETSYSGCDLQITECGQNVKREKGTINFFPSYALHNVTPLESGERNALVGWVCGPNFK